MSYSVLIAMLTISFDIIVSAGELDFFFFLVNMYFW